MRVLNRPADLFQRALEGERVTDQETTRLLATSGRLTRAGAARPRPDAEFVTNLRARLMAEAATLPTPSPAAAKAAADRRATARSTPVVVLVGRGLPRLLAGATASVLLVGAIVGVVSRGTLPGDALYPVKGWLDSVAVRLADNDFDRGQTYLGQAQEHISDARDLAGRSTRDSGQINVALQGAIDSVRGGQRAMDGSYAATGSPQALLALRDFTARALPQLDALRAEVPAGSLPLLGDLQSLVQDTQATTARRVAACGAPCATALGQPAGVDSRGSPSATGGAGGAGPAAATSSTSPTTGLTVPGAAITAPAGGSGASAPSVSAGSGGVAVGGGGGGGTLSTTGGSVHLPTVSGSVPLVPSGGVSAGGPSASLGTGGASATVPSSSLGPIPLPGATLKLP